MASNKPILCGPCRKGKVNNNADIWCYNCDEGLCSTCVSHHKRSNGTHKTIDVKSYNPSIPAINTECDKHHRQLNFYCASHLMPCCDECISTSHSKCNGTQSLASVVEKTNIEKSKESVDTDISYILYFFDKLVNAKLKNTKTGEHKYLGIKKSVEEFRKKINNHLDLLEKKLCQEADSIWNQEKTKATDFISELEGKKKTLMDMEENLHTITEHNTSKFQSFLGVHQIEKQVHQFQKYVDNLEDDERVKEVDIKMKQNDEIEPILSKLESIKSLGEVMVVKTRIDINRETRKKKEAQVESKEQFNIHNMTMKIVTKMEIKMGKLISDIIFLMDERVLLIDVDGKANCLTEDGKLENHSPIPVGFNRITQINQDTIAIGYPYAINIFNIGKETVTKVIKLDKACRGLSFFNNYLAVVLDDGEIRIIDLNGNKLKSIQVQSETYLYKLIYHNGRLIYSDSQGKSVTCIDESGRLIWQYKQNLAGPWGLCMDRYGNIIVADQSSDRIIVISKDGQDSKVLINKEDGLNNPRCICFKHNESSGLICDNDGTYLAKFNLSYG